MAEKTNTSADTTKLGKEQAVETPERRDFLTLLTVATGTVGAGAFAWPIIDSMNPSADVLALASTEVDVSALEEGQSITVK